MKNRALRNMLEQLKGGWSPKRLYTFLRWINFPGFYGGLASLKQRFGRSS